MNTKHRISSILETKSLDSSITDFPTFDLADLQIPKDLDFDLPTNVRLGHIAERVLGQAIKVSENYEVLFENIQILEGKNTIGEIDFIIQKVATKLIIHLELAYKFYLYDPKISSEAIYNWVGPNRIDSLAEKLEKVKQRQFPLLHHPQAVEQFPDVHIPNVEQKLCLLASLYMPFDYNESLAPEYQKAVVGHYVTLEQFYRLHSANTLYYIPPKKKWGMNPVLNEDWEDLDLVKETILVGLSNKRALLCWQKKVKIYAQFFIVWW